MHYGIMDDAQDTDIFEDTGRPDWNWILSARIVVARSLESSPVSNLMAAKKQSLLAFQLSVESKFMQTLAQYATSLKKT